MGTKTSNYIITVNKENELIISDLNRNIVCHIISEKYIGYEIKDDTIFITMFDEHDRFSGQDYYNVFKFENGEQVFVKRERW